MCSLLLFIITVANAPTINYEVINATAIRIYWSITGNANGFIINITSNGLPIVTQQLTDGSVREFIYNGIPPERNYTVEVRVYINLLGPANMTIVRLEGRNHTTASLNNYTNIGKDPF